VCIGLSPEDVAPSLAVLGASVVGSTLDTDPRKAAAQLSVYAAAGTKRVILAPSVVGWQHDYEFAGKPRAAL
jgi:hypothetical protein